MIVYIILAVVAAVGFVLAGKIRYELECRYAERYIKYGPDEISERGEKNGFA